MVNPATGGYRDNRELEERDDVLTFTSPVLSDALEVIGIRSSSYCTTPTTRTPISLSVCVT